MEKNTKIISSMNKNLILEYVRVDGPCSRADLTRALGLSFPAVSSNVKKLIEANLLVEIGEGDNALGRKSTQLAFNSKQAYIVGIDIGRRNIRAMCADASGAIKQYYKVRIVRNNICEAVVSAVDTVIEKSGIELADVASVGIGVPGIYNKETNKLSLAPFSDEAETSKMFALLNEKFQAQTVKIENSVNLGAIGERWMGCAKGYDNMVYFDFGVGFGASILIDGEIVHGVNGAAGEIAYMTVESEDLRDKFENEGALEQLIPSRIISEYINAMNTKEIDIDQIMIELEKTLPKSNVEKLPTYFAMSILNTIAIINPEFVVISGKLGCAIYNRFKDKIDSIIKAHIPFVPIIQCTELEEKASVIGAISIAHQSLVKDYKNLIKNPNKS